MKQLFPDIVTIWLDAHIGDPHYHAHLKAAFASNIDPTNPKPVELSKQDRNYTAWNELDSRIPHQIGIPCELKTFVDINQCLQCIRDSMTRDKRIFLIVSDSMGQYIVPRIIEEYPQAFHNENGEASISIYIFNFYLISSMEWLFDCMDYALAFSHETDLLWRLVHDIASVLCHHAQRITRYQDFKFLEDLKEWRYQCEEKIRAEMLEIESNQYSRVEMERSLNSSIFIYYSKEFYSEANQLVSTLHGLTQEQGTLFDNDDKFMAQVQAESYMIKYCCPIIIVSNKRNQMAIVDRLSSLSTVHHIYVLSPVENIPIAINDQNLFQSFPKIRHIYADIKRLVLEWTVERASLCEKMGEICTDNNDVKLAGKYFARTIRLNENLSAFIKKNDFFIHCITRDEFIDTLTRHQSTVKEIDIFVPHTAVDLIYRFRELQCPRKQFHLYCATDSLVDEYKRLVPCTNRDQVFNINRIELKLYRRAIIHVLYCIDELDGRSDAGDIDANDFRQVMADIFEQLGVYINEDIRRKSCLPQQPTASEEQYSISN
ncbi:unnamed protein product [Rotaria socialis]|uniref:Uncharacterized protein n=1 Tax=Rotaria socialis TaxID=392032 RepID=A0A820F6Z6_9BILA|nr:unnamed protein product [Rotaria socialis]CAF4257651.1 unnamed protein product [Rotaria socialis]